MDLVKKNILSIIFGVVALIALVAWFWPLGSIKAEAETELAKRGQVYSSMQSTLKADRTLPVTSVGGEAPQKLEVFPNEKVIEWGKDVTKRMQDEVQGVKAVAIRLNQRPLLVPNSLPVPAPTMEFRFRDVYLRYISEFTKLVKAGTPPTQADIAQAEQDLWKTKYEPMVIIRNGQADPASQQQVSEEFNKERPEIPDRVKVARARSILFYMDPSAMDVSTQFTTVTAGTAPSPAAIWDAQLKVWIQNDIAQAIVDLNTRDSKLGNVMDAPVKQLLKVQILPMRGAGAVVAGAPGGMGGPPMGGPPGMGSGFGPPPEVLAMMQGGGMGMGMGMGGPAATSSGPESLTGRTANALYDVVPFEIIVHVQADKLPDFLEELGRNRFITPNQVMSMRSVDTVILGAASNVMYGSAPVVEATISGEALLLRDWTVPLMPKEIKQSLSVEAAGATPAM